jgi:hypothetical protein
MNKAVVEKIFSSFKIVRIIAASHSYNMAKLNNVSTSLIPFIDMSLTFQLVTSFQPDFSHFQILNSQFF